MLLVVFELVRLLPGLAPKHEDIEGLIGIKVIRHVGLNKVFFDGIYHVKPWTDNPSLHRMHKNSSSTSR